MLTYSNGYLEAYRFFQGDFKVCGRLIRGGYMLGELSLEEFVMGEEVFMKGAKDFLVLFKKIQ